MDLQESHLISSQ